MKQHSGFSLGRGQADQRHLLGQDAAQIEAGAGKHAPHLPDELALHRRGHHGDLAVLFAAVPFLRRGRRRSRSNTG